MSKLINCRKVLGVEQADRDGCGEGMVPAALKPFNSLEIPWCPGAHSPGRWANMPAVGTESVWNHKREPLIFQDAASAPMSLCSPARHDRSTTWCSCPAHRDSCHVSCRRRRSDSGGWGHPRMCGSPARGRPRSCLGSRNPTQAPGQGALAAGWQLQESLWTTAGQLASPSLSLGRHISGGEGAGGDSAGPAPG